MPIITHLLIELFGCEPDRINNPIYVEKIMKEASALAGGTIINSLFCNQGENITGAIFLVESSYTIHTWVTGYVGLDFYTVKDLDNTKALEFLIRKFGALKYSASEIKRGAEVEKEKP